jgi:hypothetical protein
MKKSDLLKFTWVLYSLLFSANTLAFDYKCKIDRVFESTIKEDVILKSFLGQEFTVDRKTGIMVGSLKNSYITKPQVIDLGSKENSYKVIASLKVSEGVSVGSNIYALTIDEFEPGNNKPFVFLENNEVFFGSCVHY